MKLPSIIHFADESIKKAFYELEKGDSLEQDLFAAINNVFDKIERDAFCGVQIPKKLIPKAYITQYGIVNLWKYNLPGGWRLIYSIASDKVVVVSLVLEWFNHKEYERRFKY